MAELIKSTHNPKIKLVRSLHEPKGRGAHNAFVIEGRMFINEVPKGADVRFYLVSESFAAESGIAGCSAPVFIADDKTFRYASVTETPQGVLAVCGKPDSTLTDAKFNMLIKNNNPFFLLAENIQDPGNLGTVIRTADAAGVSAVFISRNSVDVFNPKTVRSAAGSIFNLPFFTETDILVLINKLRQNNIPVYGASPNGSVSLYSLNYTGGCAFVIGNEARGLTDATLRSCTAAVSIPIAGKAESLNAAVACGVLLYEALRQKTESR
jgi:TrmH family RNA methyltransferase